MATTQYPIVANCNYESADGEMADIHAARKAIDAGLTEDADLLGAMAELEATLERDSEDGSVGAVERCNAAERAVLAAWANVYEAVQAERYSRARD